MAEEKRVAFQEPEKPAESSSSDSEEEEEEIGWGAFCEQLRLDRRLARAIAELGWTRPSLVQKAALPVALSGRDVLVRARTGSGKTACYALPILHNALQAKEGAQDLGILAVVLLPTRELVAQARTQLLELAAFSRDALSVVALRGEDAKEDCRAALDGDIVCATPAACKDACDRADSEDGRDGGPHPLSRLGATCLAYAVDEADLVLGFGYDDDVKAVAARLGVSAGAAGRRPQGFLLSATLGDEVQALKKLALRRAATVRLDERAGIFGGGRDDEAQLAQYYVPVKADDKHLVTYVLLKLGLLAGRGVLFVNSVDASYRLKLFLDLFSVRTMVLNAELPLASRLHAIEAYNRGYYDLLVATDAAVETDRGSFGVARGIDFRDVQWV
eukprot:CAMPEP_0119293312 /NCGR_PEP_ID=MMETSP1329-20130426/45824_1 /TAXON_ID=114041 /ORGANISM="Genus nov. species nov., Strain RCC1024" /LENGTH=387 /DNA_ID=CAMNT_0007294177 /DNA_START=173 /DNA_END=1333 /DNA_ORIENTATION=-